MGAQQNGWSGSMREAARIQASITGKIHPLVALIQSNNPINHLIFSFSLLIFTYQNYQAHTLHYLVFVSSAGLNCTLLAYKSTQTLSIHHSTKTQIIHLV